MAFRKMFKDEMLAKIKNVAEQIHGIRLQLSKEHNSSPDKSFMKSSLEKYLEALPVFDLEAIEKLFEKDLKICEIALADSKATVE